MDVREAPRGGAPMLGEPLPIELANSTYAVRHHLVDGLETVEHLAAWLRKARNRLPIGLGGADLDELTDADLSLARELRDAVRALAHAAAAAEPQDGPAVETLNRCARQTPRWRELRLGAGPEPVVRYHGRAVAAVFAEVAEQAMALFAGDRGRQVRACPGPGCVLFFVGDDPRRHWCSAGCGNRARAARHSARVRRHA